MNEQVKAGIFGLCVGDALGVPVEFQSRQQLKEQPVTHMTGYGTHHQPAGTWSDDSSLTFCLVDSLCSGYDLYDIADTSVQWYRQGYWSPYGQVFDIGNATRAALDRLEDEFMSPEMAGLKDVHSNGNGSLMRILPLAYYLRKLPFTARIPYIRDVSSITHRHPRSIIACVIYVELACGLLEGLSPEESYRRLQPLVLQHYKQEPELVHFRDLLVGDIGTRAEQDIHSSGYVIHTLEAGIWCLLNSRSYEECVLSAVNLGEDTDTTGAVAGGLAGIWYGLGAIPPAWIQALARRNEIAELCERFAAGLEPG